MGAGKSTIGRLLAKELRLPFKDSDKEIELRTGANIPWIFDKEGEPGFRDREQAMIAELCGCDGVVLATGGGAVMREANRRALHAGGGWSICMRLSSSRWAALPVIAIDLYCVLPIRPRPSGICWRSAIRFIGKSPIWWSKPMSGRREWWCSIFSNACSSYLPVKARREMRYPRRPVMVAQGCGRWLPNGVTRADAVDIR